MDSASSSFMPAFLLSALLPTSQSYPMLLKHFARDLRLFDFGVVYLLGLLYPAPAEKLSTAHDS